MAQQTAKVVLVLDDSISADVAGAVVWTEHAGMCSREALALALTAEGVAQLAPDLVTPEQAFEHARGACRAKHVLVRRCSDRETFVLVREGAPAPDELEYDSALKVKLSPLGFLVFNNSTDPLVQTLRDEFDAALELADTHAIGSWLCKVLGRLGAIPMRPTGGFYFVDRTALGTWHAIVRAVNAAATQYGFGEICAVRTDAATVRSICASIERDVGEELERIEDHVADGKALDTQRDRAFALRERIKRYETVLGASLATLAARAEHAESTAVQAALIASMQEV